MGYVAGAAVLGAGAFYAKKQQAGRKEVIEGDDFVEIKYHV
jgi:hypothetical protein